MADYNAAVNIGRWAAAGQPNVTGPKPGCKFSFNLRQPVKELQKLAVLPG